MGAGTILATAQGNGTTASKQVRVPLSLRESHLRTLYVYGTFDTATVTLQASHNNVDFFAVTGADAITAKTAINVEMRAAWFRVVVASGNGSEAIDVVLA